MASSPSTDEPVWVVVLLDWQNIYSCARDALGLGERRDCWERAPAQTRGAVGIRNRSLAREATPAAGGAHLPRSSRWWKTPDWYRASQSQTSAWKKAGGERLVERYRDLRQRDGIWIEKGVDVSLAIDLISIAHRKEAGAHGGVSSDADLEPALELATALRGEGFLRSPVGMVPAIVAVLSVEGVLQHRLNQTDYERLHDPVVLQPAYPYPAAQG